MLQTNPDNKVTKVFSNPPVIGSKFNGPNSFIDTQNGSSWFVLPQMTDYELLIQSALLRKVKPKVAPMAVAND